MADAIRATTQVTMEVTVEVTGTILTPATIAPIPITGWDIDITVIGITAIDIMAIALTADHTTGIMAAGFITPAATAKNSGETL